jgi:oligoribonuclease (3'-5' exoribonuclease)
MTTEEKSAWTDEQSIDHIRKWVIEQFLNNYSAVRVNSIVIKKLFLSQEVLRYSEQRHYKNCYYYLKIKISTSDWLPPVS